MLVRDYIEDALYNPHYGYFSRKAQIFTPPGGSHFDFGAYKDSTQFEVAVANRYVELTQGDKRAGGKQLWHTPTELFKPWYGQAIAQCLVSEYLLKYFPYEDLVIYELGAGNGTLAEDILDFIRVQYPEVYERTRYTIIEISTSLARQQRRRLYNKHKSIQVINKSIFHWDKREESPCYVVAMEVVDNFAHDVVRYDLHTLEPYQGLVAIDEYGDFNPFYSKLTDPTIRSYLSLQRELGYPPSLGRLLGVPILRKAFANMPFAPNMSTPEYVPTRLYSLVRVLRDHFPRHRLLLSDFSSLPDAIEGVNAPVVQTRLDGTMVPCTTLFVTPGYFDIMFPTNFEQLRDMYEHVLSQPYIAGWGADLDSDASETPSDASSPRSQSPGVLSGYFSSFHPASRRIPMDGIASASGLPVGERKSSVFTHAEFLQTYSDLSRTQLRSGENPMVDFYKNVKFLF
ncbi:DUF185-domain-containing protein [Coniophora puteana RWD-64-598 SS2]|uniref:Protein arginine methyltransferase NDUFAF7 n=1 Tax=Coniophora puteana (strain RWD-64-598) TaxID=741705 RepID=A0A5M3MJP3_CONPW|nr:DUF185-domain-containing protein [Coniophora puteana RWD-64-598 SS2]EIW79150.1 DUF185-domain-containing protein [Coniophora puteana RWD-64-598 SS2]